VSIRTRGFDTATGAWVEVEGDAALTAVEEQISRPETGPWLAPGFVDIQVNGFAGADYNDPACSMELIAKSLEMQFSSGTTRLLPTVITGSETRITGALRNLLRAKRELPHGRAMEAFHVEGPHISPNDGPRGAHPRPHVRPPSNDEFLRWQEAAEGHVRLVTLSPEWPGTPQYIEFLVRQGVVVAIGHLEATGEQIADAVSAGATLSTHLGNGAHSVLPRHPNYLWTQMAEDRLAASFICDGIHLDRAFLQTALRAKGVERSVLITDAVMPAGCEPGEYTLGEVEVRLHPEGRVTLRESGRLAGSALRMDRGVEVLMRLGGLSLRDAVTMATRNPARVARVAGRLRGLTTGDRADVVEFDFDAVAQSMTVRRTWLDGELVFDRGM
jgi:N-acetylglucosamine-6-phosphate deacetylase